MERSGIDDKSVNSVNALKVLKKYPILNEYFLSIFYGDVPMSEEKFSIQLKKFKDNEEKRRRALVDFTGSGIN
jgi:hypothetical protein